MIKQEIISKIADFREIGFPAYIPREGSILHAEYCVSTVVGGRRAGKSFRVIQAATDFIKTGIIATNRHICHLDFDNPILASATIEELTKLPEIFLSITPEASLSTPLLFIFDEIHCIRGWERFVIELSRNQYWKVIVTGSSSKLLLHDIATELRGKALPTIVHPLSFKEFISFKKINNTASTTSRAAIQAAFTEFLKWGSYPIIPKTEEYVREPLLREYFNTMILKDIIERYNIGKPRTAIQLFHYLLSCMGKPFTLLSAHAFLKTIGETGSRESVTEWIHHASDSWLFTPVTLFSDSLKSKELNYKKLYVLDWALAHYNSRTWDGSLSRSLENIVYSQLTRTYPHVNYYITKTKREEIDFLITDRTGNHKKIIQVCLNITDSETLSREISPIVASAKYFGNTENFILTLDQEKIIDINGTKITVMPVWKWLLE